MKDMNTMSNTTPTTTTTTNKPKVRGFIQTPRQAVDSDGTPILLVPLPTGQEVKVLPEDWERLKAQGYAPGWILNDNGWGQKYVKFARAESGNTLAVARLIVNAGPGESVCYLSERLNLRRDCLSIKRANKLTADRLAALR